MVKTRKLRSHSEDGGKYRFLHRFANGLVGEAVLEVKAGKVIAGVLVLHHEREKAFAQSCEEVMDMLFAWEEVICADLKVESPLLQVPWIDAPFKP